MINVNMGKVQAPTCIISRQIISTGSRSDIKDKKPIKRELVKEAIFLVDDGRENDDFKVEDEYDSSSEDDLLTDESSIKNQEKNFNGCLKNGDPINNKQNKSLEDPSKTEQNDKVDVPLKTEQNEEVDDSSLKSVRDDEVDSRLKSDVFDYPINNKKDGNFDGSLNNQNFDFNDTLQNEDDDDVESLSDSECLQIDEDDQELDDDDEVVEKFTSNDPSCEDKEARNEKKKENNGTSDFSKQCKRKMRLNRFSITLPPEELKRRILADQPHLHPDLKVVLLDEYQKAQHHYVKIEAADDDDEEIDVGDSVFIGNKFTEIVYDEDSEGDSDDVVFDDDFVSKENNIVISDDDCVEVDPLSSSLVECTIRENTDEDGVGHSKKPARFRVRERSMSSGEPPTKKRFNTSKDDINDATFVSRTPATTSPPCEKSILIGGVVKKLLPLKKKSGIIPLKKKSELIPLKKKTELIPFKKNTELIPLKKKTELIPLKKKTELIPLKKKTELIPLKEKTELIPLKKKTELIPFKKKTELIPFKKKTELIPLKKKSEAGLAKIMKPVLSKDNLKAVNLPMSGTGKSILRLLPQMGKVKEPVETSNLVNNFRPIKPALLESSDKKLTPKNLSPSQKFIKLSDMKEKEAGVFYNYKLPGQPVVKVLAKPQGANAKSKFLQSSSTNKIIFKPSVCNNSNLKSNSLVKFPMGSKMTVSPKTNIKTPNQPKLPVLKLSPLSQSSNGISPGTKLNTTLKCQFCNVLFLKQETLRSHLVTKHKDDLRNLNKAALPKINKPVAISLKNLKNVIIVPKKSNSKEKFPSLVTLADLLEMERELKDRASTCNECQGGLWWVIHLKGHARTHIYGDADCALCLQGGTAYKKYMNHLESHAPDSDSDCEIVEPEV